MRMRFDHRHTRLRRVGASPLTRLGISASWISCLVRNFRAPSRLCRHYWEAAPVRTGYRLGIAGLAWLRAPENQVRSPSRILSPAWLKWRSVVDACLIHRCLAARRLMQSVSLQSLSERWRNRSRPRASKVRSTARQCHRRERSAVSIRQSATGLSWERLKVLPSSSRTVSVVTKRQPASESWRLTATASSCQSFCLLPRTTRTAVSTNTWRIHDAPR
jgi:hypothetical protein